MSDKAAGAAGMVPEFHETHGIPIRTRPTAVLLDLLDDRIRAALDARSVEAQAAAQEEAVLSWWRAYSASIHNRRDNHPTAQRQAEKARDEAFTAVLAALGLGGGAAS